MKLKALLEGRRRAILRDWTAAILATYPSGGMVSVRANGDRFEHPLADAVARTAAALFDALVAGDPTRLGAILDELVRLRAVQTFTPAEATGFVFELKSILRKALKRELKAAGLATELLEFERRIDRAALVAFDLYMVCREKVMKLRLDAAETAARQALDMSPVPPRVTAGKGSRRMHGRGRGVNR